MRWPWLGRHYAVSACLRRLHVDDSDRTRLEGFCFVSCRWFWHVPLSKKCHPFKVVPSFYMKRQCSCQLFKKERSTSSTRQVGVDRQKNLTSPLARHRHHPCHPGCLQVTYPLRYSCYSDIAHTSLPRWSTSVWYSSTSSSTHCHHHYIVHKDGNASSDSIIAWRDTTPMKALTAFDDQDFTNTSTSQVMTPKPMHTVLAKPLCAWWDFSNLSKTGGLT
jgi:hypothetical protein